MDKQATCERLFIAGFVVTCLTHQGVRVAIERHEDEMELCVRYTDKTYAFIIDRSEFYDDEYAPSDYLRVGEFIGRDCLKRLGLSAFTEPIVESALSTNGNLIGEA